MEINRKILKKNAWNALKGIYWFMFLACIVAGIVGAAGGGGIGFGLNIDLPAEKLISGGNFSSQSHMRPAEPSVRGRGSFSAFDDLDSLEDAIEDFFERELDIRKNPEQTILFAAIFALGILVFVVAIVFSIFISGPAEVSFARLKLSAVVDRSTDSSNAFYAFKNNYKNMVKTTFLKNLYIFLWSLLPTAAAVFMLILLILSRNIFAALAIMVFMTIAVIALSIPAVIKRYQYMAVPYIMAENPHISARAALKQSSDMMNGFKWQTFVLRLSFLGWYILGALCCGIGALFVSPYYHATETLLYEELKAYHGANSAEVKKIDVIP